MLITEEIKKELDAGREIKLECVDKNGLLGAVDSKYNYNKLILESSLQVSRYFIDGAGLLVLVIEPGLMMTEEELKYFRIKRPTPTFDDLIDVATQAVRDKILMSLEFTNSSIHYISKDRLPEKNRHELSCRSKYLGISGLSPNMQIHYIKKEIDLITSLYNETFVIEDELDIMKVKCKAEVTMTNGEKGICGPPYIAAPGDSKVVNIKHGEQTNYSVGFLSLKGATVIQKRGAA